jgi:hypothetical protein
MVKKTRAQQMVDRLKESTSPIKVEKPREIKAQDKETPEMREKLKKAREKLATFKDLLN